jgi:hypothetical protein
LSDRQDLFGFGYVIDSALPVPGAIARQSIASAGLPIVIDLLPDRPAMASGRESFTRNGHGICYDAPATASYDCQANGIAVTRTTGADPDMVANLLVANALPTTLWLRGQYLLHAAVVHWPALSMSFAICGPSGSGKSMLATQWIDEGALLVADDVLAIDVDGGFGRGAGLPGGIHLPRDEKGNRSFRALASDQSLTGDPLGAILILERAAPDHTFELGRLSAIDAVEALLQNRHRPIVPLLLERNAAVLAQASIIAARTPVFRWSRPDGAPMMSTQERDLLLSACVT